MNFAMSEHRTDRHPVGIMVVIGLHVALGAALLSARLRTPPAPPRVVELKPVDEAMKKLEPTKQLDPPKQVLPDRVLRIPDDFKTDEPDPLHAERVVDDKPVADPPLVVVASIKGDGEKHDTPHFTPRHTVLDAGAVQCRPSYPAAAQRAGAEGISRIRFTVDAAGHVVGAQILQASGASREHRLMDKAAAEALAQCPVTMGIDEQGRPVGGMADVEYRWSLN